MPEPSRLILFEHLWNASQGTKVRFLACVHSYEPKTARLILRDSQAASSSRNTQSAVVNIDNILENVSHEVLEAGAWINVVGTVHTIEGAQKETKSSRRSARSSRKTPFVVADATMIWSAGAIKLGEYRSAVEVYQRAVTSE